MIRAVSGYSLVRVKSLMAGFVSCMSLGLWIAEKLMFLWQARVTG